MDDPVLLFGDCLELMADITDGSINLVLCDLPYGTTRNKWDSVIPLPELWAHYTRILAPHGAVVLNCQMPFTAIVGASNLPWLRYEWVWEKNVATGHLNANRAPMKLHENILVFAPTVPTYNPVKLPGRPYTVKRRRENDSGSNYGAVTRTDTHNSGNRFPVSILRFARETGLHPTQKPVSLFEYLVRTYTNPGDTVLDNCMGSGTTGIACLNTCRSFIGIEKDSQYFDVAQERIENHRCPTTISNAATAGSSSNAT